MVKPIDGNSIVYDAAQSKSNITTSAEVATGAKHHVSATNLDGKTYTSATIRKDGALHIRSGGPGEFASDVTLEANGSVHRTGVSGKEVAVKDPAMIKAMQDAKGLFKDGITYNELDKLAAVADKVAGNSPQTAAPTTGRKL